MISLRPYQQAAVNAVYDYFQNHSGNPLVVLPTGCHARGTLILMADGSTKAVEHIAVGDRLMGPDSLPRTVLHLCRGRQPMYRITPKKRAPFVVNEDHVLALRCTNEGKHYPCSKNKSHRDFITVGEYLRKPKSWKHLRKLEYSQGVIFDRDEQEVPLAPWLLGALLGDGHLKNTPSITTPDIEVLSGVLDYIQTAGMDFRVSHNQNLCPTVHITKKTNVQTNNLVQALQILGLWGKLAHEKFIPDVYKYGSWHVRLEVLAGLLDTDGHYENGGYDWISKSKQLAHDLVFVARSLGIKAQVSEQYKQCQTGVGGIYYRVSLSGDLSHIPARVERKRPHPRKQIKSPFVSGFTIEAVGEDEYFGFTLDGDHLYLDDQFLIHHNSGKSLTLAAFIKGAIEQYPSTRIILLTHVKELVQQDAQAILRYWQQAPVGIWSAGLGIKSKNQITVASIQSIHRLPAKFAGTDLVIIDEAHLLSKNSDTMYGRFIQGLRQHNPHLKIIGLTATPYRMDSGLLTTGKHRIFTDIAYDAGVGQLIKDGWLCPLVARNGATRADLSDVHTRGGEFVASELQSAMDKNHLIQGALDEVARYAHDRRHILGFCAGVEHARHCAEECQARGWSADYVTGDMPSGVRDAKINAFKDGRTRILFNAMLLTTGFDAPHTDCILMLRPTKSTGLYVQVMGRGLRKHADKENTLVLDFAGNVERHGPIDQIRITDKPEKGEGVSVAPVKECANCNALVHAAVRECPECGHAFPEPQNEKHGTQASDAVIVAALEKPRTFAVDQVIYSRHQKAGKPDSVKVEYLCGVSSFCEWLPIEDARPYVKKHAVSWFWHRGCICPDTVSDALQMARENRIPAPDAITVKQDGKYWRILAADMGARRLDVSSVSDDEVTSF